MKLPVIKQDVSSLDQSFPCQVMIHQLCKFDTSFSCLFSSCLCSGVAGVLAVGGDEGGGALAFTSSNSFAIFLASSSVPSSVNILQLGVPQ